MVTINITYQGDLHCEATHGPSSATLATDAPKDNHGKGESFSPTDLVATALGSCMLTVMGIAARTLGLSIDGATAHVIKEMTPPPRRVGTLRVSIRIPGNFSAPHKKALEDAALKCPVHQSLHPDIAIPIEFTWE